MSTYWFKLLLALAYVVATTNGTLLDRNPRKRQIYREQVLPHAGGRIPDTAFETDRLFLNQLQKDGIAVPDGILPEQRNPQVYPFFNRPSRKVYRIALSSDGRYTPQEGRYQYNQLPAIDTTYLFPQIHGQRTSLAPQSVPLPVYSPFRIHNPLLNQVNLQPKDKAQFQNVSPSSANKGLSKAKSYQNFNIFNSPLSPLIGKETPTGASGDGSKNYLPDFSYSGQNHLFNNFDDLFNQFDIQDGQAKKSNSYSSATNNNIQRSHYHHIATYQRTRSKSIHLKLLLMIFIPFWPTVMRSKTFDLPVGQTVEVFKSNGTEAKNLDNPNKQLLAVMFSLRFLTTICLSLLSAYAVYAIQVQTFGHLFHPPAGEHPHHHKEEKQDLNKIPGVPGVDYPIYHEVPNTSFSCAHVPAVPGMYANLETGCQAYHVCHDGREGHQGASFLCTNGTIFNQKEFACDWWYNVKCEEAANYYHLNADPEHNPYTPKKKLIEQEHLTPIDHHDHGGGFLIHA
ncbi:uncharacterized protein LOC142235839 [Haematobia irritans]|uniref:uncharacterized protein LOC142235839 n=1 Tax=Haematobia irritans TaxID=7368 RepID=UPI003F4F958E